MCPRRRHQTAGLRSGAAPKTRKCSTQQPPDSRTRFFTPGPARTSQGPSLCGMLARRPERVVLRDCHHHDSTCNSFTCEQPRKGLLRTEREGLKIYALLTVGPRGFSPIFVKLLIIMFTAYRIQRKLSFLICLEVKEGMGRDDVYSVSTVYQALL